MSSISATIVNLKTIEEPFLEFLNVEWNCSTNLTDVVFAHNH